MPYITRATIRNREDDARQLAARFPSDVLLTVRGNDAPDRHAFTILGLDHTPPLPLFSGRFDVVAAWINGYLTRHTQRNP